MISKRWAILLSVLCSRARAAPPAVTIAPSPTGASCSFHVDHWDCTSLCTETSSWYGISTTVTNFDEFQNSLDSVYKSRSLTGNSIPVHTTAFTFPGLGYITAYGYYNSEALKSAGYQIISGVSTITEPCKPTASLPPSPTGSDCTPHGDHFLRKHANPMVTTGIALPACPNLRRRQEPLQQANHQLLLPVNLMTIIGTVPQASQYLQRHLGGLLQRANRLQPLLPANPMETTGTALQACHTLQPLQGPLHQANHQQPRLANLMTIIGTVPQASQYLQHHLEDLPQRASRQE
ncbi:hypothetical protein LOZ65_000936 [Ophidiomyces ophidiicola]|nr:hypothetical protein LOZ65_000936 [Ophidiomyces ophidiicola]